MKKNLLLFGLLALMTGALSSCSSDDTTAITADADTAVTFTLTAPEAMHTRAEGDIAGYEFRMVVYKKGTETKVAEETKTEGSDMLTTFSASLPKGTAYDCIFSMQELIEGSSGAASAQYYYDGKIAGIPTDRFDRKVKFYSGISAIGADGTPDNNGNVKLTHAVAQLNIQTTVPMESVKYMSANPAGIPTEINLLSGEVTDDGGAGRFKWNDAETTDASVQNPVTLLTLYLPAPATETYSGASVEIELYAYDAQQSLMETITVPNVPLRANYRTNIIGDLSGMVANTFSVSVDETFNADETTVDPVIRIGAYLNADGKFTSEKTASSVARVFHVGRHASDDCTYPDAINSNPVHGYAVALSDVLIGASGWNSGMIESEDTGMWDGYSRTQTLKSSSSASSNPAVRVSDWDVQAPANTSGWFMPSAAQWADVYTNLNSLIIAGETLNANYFIPAMKEEPSGSGNWLMGCCTLNTGAVNYTSDRRYSELRGMLAF